MSGLIFESSLSALSLVTPVLVAGFLGSGHCATMCGPLVLAVSRGRKQLLVYQIARVFSYTSIGAVLGFAGETLSALVPHEYTFAPFLLFSSVLIWFGFLQAFRGPVHFRIPAISILFSKLQRFAYNRVNRGTPHRWILPALCGCLSIFLPCGHLYVFFAAAASAGSALGGALVMGAFAVGSLPALSFGLTLIQKLLSPLERRRVSGALLIAAGLFSLGGFWYRHAETVKGEAAPQHEAPRCH